jgi:hypothetical protein
MKFTRSLVDTLRARAAGLPVSDEKNNTSKHEPYHDNIMNEPMVVKDVDEYHLDL